MTYTSNFDDFDPEAANFSGMCGIRYLLEMRGEVEIWRDSAGNITDSFYSFYQRFTKISGCMHNSVGYPIKSLDNDVYGPIITENLDDGSTVENISYRIRIFFDDFCGVCYNPGNVSIGGFTNISNTNDGSGDEAQQLIDLMKQWSDRLPPGETWPLGDTFGRRLLFQWTRLFNVNEDWAQVEDPCGSSIQSQCASTPPTP